MKDPDDPVRFAEDSNAPSGLRDALQRAREDLGTDAEVARLAAKLGPLLGPPAPLAPAAATVASGVTAKLGLGAFALLVAGGGAWLLSAQTTSAPPPAPAPSVAARLPPPAPTPEAAPPPFIAERTSADVTAPSATPSLGKPPASSRPPSLLAPSEAELLEQARAALKSGDSARAFQRVSEHAQRYPRGVLVQEREVLAIQALRRLGRDAEAERRAAAFAKAYPGSAFQRKLQR